MLQPPPCSCWTSPTANLSPKVAAGLLSEHVRTLAEADAAVLHRRGRTAKAIVAPSPTSTPGVFSSRPLLMADTPARLSASRGSSNPLRPVPQTPK